MMQRSNTPLKAIILVGGEGTRLRPLTNLLPKSMLPVLNRPFLEHIIDYLASYGIKHIILTISYMPDVIQGYFGDGSAFGVKLTYALEDQPLGTAGAVKNAERFLDGSFVVLNGDIYTNLNLSDMIAFHRRSKAKATIALTRVEDPGAFGVVETGPQQRILRFIEKPAPGQTTSHWINAGIYMLEPDVLKYVPENKHFMFEKGLFPLLIEKGEPVYGYPFSGQWLDMGTPDKYRRLNCDLLLAKGKGIPGGPDSDGCYIAEDASVHPTVRITGPAVIASRCRIGQGTCLKGPVVLGPGCHIEDGAILEGSVLWRGVVVGSGAVLKSCIVSDDTEIPAAKQLLNQTVVQDSNQQSNKPS
jgi:mannose-1-phosphate guanylyltransferase